MLRSASVEDHVEATREREGPLLTPASALSPRPITETVTNRGRYYTPTFARPPDWAVPSSRVLVGLWHLAAQLSAALVFGPLKVELRFGNSLTGWMLLAHRSVES